MNLKLLAPGAHSKKAIYGAAVAFFTALSGAAKSGGISFVETIGIVGATVLGYLAVWAGKNVDVDNSAGSSNKSSGLLGDAGHTRSDLLVVLTFVGVVILVVLLVVDRS